MATKKEGKTGEELLILLESRLDNIVFRMGWAGSRAEARQLVVHGHFSVNGRKVDIPSFLAKAGDVVSIRDASRKSDKFKAILETNESRPVPKWLDLNREALTGTVVALPKRDEIDLAVDETLIVELYSK
jgi:small subunit ribosomal protein S4